MKLKRRRLLSRRSRSLTYSLLAALITAVVAGATLSSSARPGWSHLGVLTVFIAGMVIGSYLRADHSHDTGATPITLALAYATLLNTDTPRGSHAHDYAVAFLTAVAGLSAAALFGPRTHGLRTVFSAVPPAVIGLTATTVAYWAIPVGSSDSAAEASVRWLQTPWWTAIAMVAAVAIGVAVYGGLQASLGGSLMPGFPRGRGETATVGASVVVTAVAIALGCGVLGALAIPLMTVPLISMFVAIRRRVDAVATRTQTIVALARLAELAGYIPVGHSARVAALSQRVAAALDLPRHELPALNEAALTHDIGQVMLRRPVPDGSTIDLAPSDQQAIASEGARIIQAGEVFEDVAEVLRAQATQFRRVQELHEPVPLHSRIVKVCSAYDDVCHGDARNHHVAIERLSLGVGYEYDPDVLNALEAVTPVGPDPSSTRERSPR